MENKRVYDLRLADNSSDRQRKLQCVASEAEQFDRDQNVLVHVGTDLNFDEDVDLDHRDEDVGEFDTREHHIKHHYPHDNDRNEHEPSESQEQNGEAAAHRVLDATSMQQHGDDDDDDDGHGVGGGMITEEGGVKQEGQEGMVDARIIHNQNGEDSLLQNDHDVPEEEEGRKSSPEVESRIAAIQSKMQSFTETVSAMLEAGKSYFSDAATAFEDRIVELHQVHMKHWEEEIQQLLQIDDVNEEMSLRLTNAQDVYSRFGGNFGQSRIRGI